MLDENKETQQSIEVDETLTKQARTPVQKVIFVLSVAFACFFLYTAFMGPFIGTVQRSVHVAGGLFIWAFMDLYSEKTKNKPLLRAVNIAMMVIFAVTLAYFIYSGKRMLMPNFQMTTPLFILGILFMLCVMETARRTIGLAVPILAMIGLAYALFGKQIPGVMSHPGFSLRTIMEVLVYSDRGIHGSVTGISATIISTFIIFGGILFATGGGKTFIDLASIIAGNAWGGAAKMAAIASGLFGMISGSSAANVATTGAFTIPMMKKMGYSNDFAGATEASASSGGQIMPPIMGAGAFIMADMLGITYKQIALAAIIPSLLFYYGVIFGIDCYAKRYNYAGIPREDLPKAKDVLYYKNSLPIFLPIGVLITLFCMGYTAVACASYSIIVAVLLYLILDLKDMKHRIGVLIEGLADATKDMLGVISLIACSQILICLISMTGIGVKFTKIIIMLGGSNMLLAGLAAMVATMILGMGMPTVAAYILAGSVIAPAMIQIGIEPLAAHFFVFYYAIFAGLTPPVCGTVFVAAALAQSNWIKTAGISIRLSIGAFLVPFILIFNPSMILIGTTGEIIRTTISAVFGMTALAAGFMGYFTRILNWPVRLLLVVAGCALVETHMITDIIGIGIILITLIALYMTKDKAAAQAAAKNSIKS